MIPSLNSQMMVLVAHGLLPGSTPNGGTAPRTFGCTAVAQGGATIWLVTLDKPLVAGSFYFFWGPTVINGGTSGALTGVTVSGSSTDSAKTLTFQGGGSGDICFAFFQIPTG